MDAVTEFARPPARLAGPMFRPPAPEPRPTPLNLIGLMRVLSKNPIECWATEHFEQPAVTASRLLGHVVVLNEPTAIRRVLLDHASNYRKDTLQRRVLSAGLGEGLLSAEAEQWQVQRRILAPMFSHRMVGAFTPAIMQAAQAAVMRWRGLCASSPSQGFQLDVAAEMTRVTLDVLVRTIFSDGLGCDSEQLRAAMSTYFEAIGRIDPLDLLGAPDFIPRLSRWRARLVMRFFDSAIDKIIATRRARLARDPAGVPEDLLTLLLNALDPDTGRRMTEAEVRSNILTFIAAGHETTANCLSWSLFLLSQSPFWNERVTAEAIHEAGGPISELADRLVVTRAVIDESLRLYPPIAAISRVARGPDELAGVTVKRGSMVVIAPWVLHRHRRLWHDPDLFDPSRFLPGARAGIDRFAWLPFGAGMRTCIGATFALREATLVLATIMKHFTLEPVQEHLVWPVLRVTLRPEGGLPMTVTPRQFD
jgi:cytochrome P450